VKIRTVSVFAFFVFFFPPKPKQNKLVSTLADAARPESRGKRVQFRCGAVCVAATVALVAQEDQRLVRLLAAHHAALAREALPLVRLDLVHKLIRKIHATWVALVVALCALHHRIL